MRQFDLESRVQRGRTVQQRRHKICALATRAPNLKREAFSSQGDIAQLLGSESRRAEPEEARLVRRRERNRLLRLPAGTDYDYEPDERILRPGLHYGAGNPQRKAGAECEAPRPDRLVDRASTRLYVNGTVRGSRYSRHRASPFVR